MSNMLFMLFFMYFEGLRKPSVGASSYRCGSNNAVVGGGGCFRWWFWSFY